MREIGGGLRCGLAKRAGHYLLNLKSIQCAAAAAGEARARARERKTSVNFPRDKWRLIGKTLPLSLSLS